VFSEPPTESIWLTMLMPSALRATRSGISASRLAEPLAEIHVVVVVHHLVAGERLVAIAVREGESGGVRRLSAVGARIEEHGHPLRRTGTRAVKSEVRLVLGFVFVLGLTDTEREGFLGFLAVEVVTEIHRDLARPEEVVRRRKHGDGSAAATIGHHDATVRLQGHIVAIDETVEQVLLPGVGGVTPSHA
jgi:hypothetical protein